MTKNPAAPRHTALEDASIALYIAVRGLLDTLDDEERGQPSFAHLGKCAGRVAKILGLDR